MSRITLKIELEVAIAALTRAVAHADELAPCSEQSRCREALAALGAVYDAKAEDA